MYASPRSDQADDGIGFQWPLLDKSIGQNITAPCSRQIVFAFAAEASTDKRLNSSCDKESPPIPSQTFQYFW